MSVIFVALPIAIALAGAAVIGFSWSAKQGQFEDLETARWRIIIDDRDSSHTIPSKQESTKVDQAE